MESGGGRPESLRERQRWTERKRRENGVREMVEKSKRKKKIMKKDKDEEKMKRETNTVE